MTTTSAPAPNSTAKNGGTVTARTSDGTELVTPLGRTEIADAVVSKIAGLAAREVQGVYQLGGGTARAFGAIRERIPGGTTNASQGVRVEVGERQAAVDLDLSVHYGVAIADVASAIRRNVIAAIERMTGLEVVEVNILVNDVRLPVDEEGEVVEAPRAEPRVL